MDGRPIDQRDYVRRLLEAYRATPGTSGAVRRADRALAAQLHERGVPLEAVENAFVLAAARRMIRPAEPSRNRRLASGSRAEDLVRPPRSRLTAGGRPDRSALIGTDGLAAPRRGFGHWSTPPLCRQGPQRAMYAACQDNRGRAEGVAAGAAQARHRGAIPQCPRRATQPGWSRRFAGQARGDRL